jgi:hypothetical protein
MGVEDKRELRNETMKIASAITDAAIMNPGTVRQT